MEDKTNENKLKIECIPILKQFEDIFSEEVHGHPMKIYIDFTIDIITGVVPVSKYPYGMNIIELIELKSKSQELIKSIFDLVFPLREHQSYL